MTVAMLSLRKRGWNIEAIADAVGVGRELVRRELRVKGLLPGRGIEVERAILSILSSGKAQSIRELSWILKKDYACILKGLRRLVRKGTVRIARKARAKGLGGSDGSLPALYAITPPTPASPAPVRRGQALLATSPSCPTSFAIR
jgi:hypothetical protein